MVAPGRHLAELAHVDGGGGHRRFRRQPHHRLRLLVDASQAALDGNAVALADFAMVANDLSEGRLVRPFELGIKVAPEFAYFLVYPVASANDARIMAFKDWILNEVHNPQPDPTRQTGKL